MSSAWGNNGDAPRFLFPIRAATSDPPTPIAIDTASLTDPKHDGKPAVCAGPAGESLRVNGSLEKAYRVHIGSTELTLDRAVARIDETGHGCMATIEGASGDWEISIPPHDLEHAWGSEQTSGVAHLQPLSCKWE